MSIKRQLLTVLLSVFITLAVVFGVLTGIRVWHAGNDQIKEVTMVQLLATPERYHGQRVRVIGVGNLEAENNFISLSKEDLLYATGNSLWIELDGDTVSYEEAKACNGEYVILEGTFYQDDHGHMNLFRGAIKEITRYERHKGAAEPTTPGDAPKPLPAPYDAIVSNLVSAFPWNDDDEDMVPQQPELSYLYRRSESLSDVGYALMDVDGNGQEELILSNVSECFIYDLYTISQGKAVHLLDSGERYCHSLYENGWIENQWSASAFISGHDFYKVNGDTLELMETITYDAYRALDLGLIDEFTQDESKCYFRTTSKNPADYQSITADEAKTAIEAYQTASTPMQIEYTLLSEYKN